MSTKDEASDIEEEKEKETVEKIQESQDVKESHENNDASIEAPVPLVLSSTLHERFLQIKQIVKDAITANHTFMIYGRAKVIRDCLLKRGWIEKFYRRNSNGEQTRHRQLIARTSRRLRPRNVLVADQLQQNHQQQQSHLQQQQQQQLIVPQTQQHVGVDSSPVVLLSGIGDLKDEQSQRLLMSKMLANHTINFLWNSGSEWPGWPSQENKSTIFNRFSRAGFTSKVGLCSNVRQMHWYYEPGVANTLFPRCYNICQPDHLHAFIDDFRLTACVSLLKWFIEKTDTEGENSIMSSTGLVPLKALDFAIRRCSDFIAAQAHEDIDKESERVWSHQWDQFICWYYKIIHNETVFLGASTPLQKYIIAAKHIVKRIIKYWHQFDMDGVLNIWILKPGNKSRGRGIVLMNKLEDVVAKVNPANKSDTRYVVQKYIEKPLLIYSTKFDIRQWFIVTCAQPLTLWMYRESYLRFCSQEFRLDDLHESIHLSNHAVQCKYKNSSDRDSALPVENMWDATTFKQFLKSQGHSDVWEELIYPGMKQGLVGSLLASQEAMDRRKNSFELYGADFMVMEDFSVWLIEINSHPDMSNSTSVTTRLCKQVMEDTVKVVIDFREDKNANTGLFELAYKQKMPSCQPYCGTALAIQGTRINTNEKKHSPDAKFIPKLPLNCPSRKKSTGNTYIGPVIVDLIEELEIQLDRELYTYYKGNSSDDSNCPSPIATTLVVPSSPNSLAPVPAAPPNGSPNSALTNLTKNAPGSFGACSKSKSPAPVDIKNKQVNNSPHKAPVKVKKLIKDKLKTSEVASTKQNGTFTKNQRELAKTAEFRTEKSAKRKTQNEDKLIGKAMRNAMNKYKKYGSIPLDISTLPSLVIPGRPGTRVIRTAVSNKLKNTIGNQKKREDETEMTNMYAVGLGLTK